MALIQRISVIAVGTTIASSTGAYVSYCYRDIPQLKQEESKLEDKLAVKGRIHPSEFSDWSISGNCGNKCQDGMEIAL